MFARLLILTFAALLTMSLKAEETEPKYSLSELLDYLQLDGHIEGGFFRRTYQADNTARIETPAGERYSMTSIFYLLSVESPIGHFHLNKSDIVHYFHLGDPIEYILIYPDGKLETHIMGKRLHLGDKLQMTVPGNVWKASRILDGGTQGYSLISEAVSPGFDYADMTLGVRDSLIAIFPQHRDYIEDLAHKSLPE